MLLGKTTSSSANFRPKKTQQQHEGASKHYNNTNPSEPALALNLRLLHQPEILNNVGKKPRKLRNTNILEAQDKSQDMGQNRRETSIRAWQQEGRKKHQMSSI